MKTTLEILGWDIPANEVFYWRPTVLPRSEFARSKRSSARATRRHCNLERYVLAQRENRPNPLGGGIPKALEVRDKHQLMADWIWKRELLARPEEEWFAAIDCATQKWHIRVQLANIIYRHRHLQSNITSAKWQKRFDGCDLQTLPKTDYAELEYALHLCGYPPLQARQLCMAYVSEAGIPWFLKGLCWCPACSRIEIDFKGYTTQCPSCGKGHVMEEVKYV